MKVCFPVQHDEGMNSRVFNHFGSAPKFLVVDIETNETAAIVNRDQHHSHGACNPLKALDGAAIDAVIVGGIGAGALTKLNQAGVRVFRAEPGTIQENIELFKSSSLSEYGMQSCCSGHAHGGNCTHH